MPTSYPHQLKHQAETALVDDRFDFIAKYHAVADLRRLARNHPALLDEESLAALASLIRSRSFNHVRQAYFLFREAAAVMTDLATAPKTNGVGTTALTTLQALLKQINGSAHRGVAEALGSLPLAICGPPVNCQARQTAGPLTWEALLASQGLDIDNAPHYVGRSLVAPMAGGRRLLVVKLAKPDDTAAGLGAEIAWMEHLRQPGYNTDHRFQIPRPLLVDDCRVIRLRSLPVPPPCQRHPDRLAIAFVAHPDYFVYPNQPDMQAATAQEILARNAFLLGWLAGNGVVHNAPIPLFHNRTQRLRRDDQGHYQWFRAGRLDQWLDSCAFPNFGLSGLRDFEHFEAACGNNRTLYRHMGSHFFSLLLVAGSFFRNQDRSLVGLDDKNQAVDARTLFDHRMLGDMVDAIFCSYCHGFTGKKPQASLPLDRDHLVGRMVEEMGVDRYMTELLRQTDQKSLTDEQFVAFLEEKGLAADGQTKLRRGEQDILITSGPHLGDFNRQISLPELIETVAAMAATCIVERYTRDQMSED